VCLSGDCGGAINLLVVVRVRPQFEKSNNKFTGGSLKQLARRAICHPLCWIRANIAFALLASAVLTACSQTQGYLTNRPAEPDVLDKVRGLDINPRFPQAQAATDQRSNAQAKATIYQDETSDPEATASIVTPTSIITPTAIQSPNGPAYDLNFEVAPVATVAKVVIGDIMGAGYSIDPRVQGTVSLSSAKPVPKSEIPYVIENALKQNGVALIRDGPGYRLVPFGDAAGSGPVDSASGRTEPGYGLSVLPLQHISAPTLIKLLDSFAIKPGMVRADAGRNILLIQGTGAERRSAVETALSFDVDWMKGRSAGIFPIQNSNPEPIIAELQKILDTGESGLSQNMIQFQPVARMNAILAVSSKPGMLKIAEKWIRRLDNADTAGSGVHVYRIKYGEARQLARVLNDIFLGARASSFDDASSNQIAPGSGKILSSSAERLAPSQNSGPAGARPQTTPAQFGGSNPAASVNTLRSSASDRGDPASSGGLDDSVGSMRPILPNLRITPDTVNNTLLIYARQEDYRIVERTLAQLDRPQLQVAIDATVAEVTLNDTLAYGVQTYLTSKNVGLGRDKGSVLTTNSTTPAAAPALASAAGVAANAFLNRAFPGFNFLVGSEAQPNFILNALHDVTSVKVLSNPSLVVIDNQAAILQVGDQVPVSTGTATVLTTNNTIVNTIDYRSTGIILRIAPRINANGNVRLDIEQEISNVSNNNSAQTLTPTVSERKVKSSISVASGQTVLLAGLISEQQQGSSIGIPGIDQIPLLGPALSNINNGRVRTELIIFIRPQIIRDSVDAHFVAEELRTKLRGTFSNTVDTRVAR
jgi:general secretion pathway protein D